MRVGGCFRTKRPAETGQAGWASGLERGSSRLKTTRPAEPGGRWLAFRLGAGIGGQRPGDRRGRPKVPSPEFKLLGPGFGFSLIAVLADGMKAHLGADHARGRDIGTLGRCPRERDRLAATDFRDIGTTITMA